MSFLKNTIFGSVSQNLFPVWVKNAKHYKGLCFTKTNCKLIQKETCLLQVLPWHMKNAEPNFSKNQKCLLRIQTICPKWGIKYFVKITQKAEKYLEVSERKIRVHLLARLLARYLNQTTAFISREICDHMV